MNTRSDGRRLVLERYTACEARYRARLVPAQISDTATAGAGRAHQDNGRQLQLGRGIDFAVDPGMRLEPAGDSGVPCTAIMRLPARVQADYLGVIGEPVNLAAATSLPNAFCLVAEGRWYRRGRTERTGWRLRLRAG
jgi:hypothetical protein